ncbi:hypothetical protein ZWY2020_051203 [Hordeum vulgare]|nr:hypothetical protein ZWY2020_051203 [Hordeum vulgare]
MDSAAGMRESALDLLAALLTGRAPAAAADGDGARAAACSRAPTARAGGRLSPGGARGSSRSSARGSTSCAAASRCSSAGATTPEARRAACEARPTEEQEPDGRAPSHPLSPADPPPV